MRSWGTALAAYVAIVLLGTGVIYERLYDIRELPDITLPRVPWSPPRIHYRASRVLPIHRRLQASDLTISKLVPTRLETHLPKTGGLVGRYLSRKIDAGEIIRDVDLSSRPRVEAQQGHTLIAIPLDGDDGSTRDITAGSIINLCDEAKCLLRSINVVAVDCPTTVAKECVALVSMSKEQMDVLNSAGKDGDRSLVIRHRFEVR